jgi:hypothetical protein
MKYSKQAVSSQLDAYLRNENDKIYYNPSNETVAERKLERLLVTLWSFLVSQVYIAITGFGSDLEFIVKIFLAVWGITVPLEVPLVVTFCSRAFVYLLLVMLFPRVANLFRRYGECLVILSVFVAFLLIKIGIKYKKVSSSLPVYLSLLQKTFLLKAPTFCGFPVPSSYLSVIELLELENSRKYPNKQLIYDQLYELYEVISLSFDFSSAVEKKRDKSILTMKEIYHLQSLLFTELTLTDYVSSLTKLIEWRKSYDDVSFYNLFLEVLSYQQKFFSLITILLKNFICLYHLELEIQTPLKNFIAADSRSSSHRQQVDNKYPLQLFQFQTNLKKMRILFDKINNNLYLLELWSFINQIDLLLLENPSEELRKSILQDLSYLLTNVDTSLRPCLETLEDMSIFKEVRIGLTNIRDVLKSRSVNNHGGIENNFSLATRENEESNLENNHNTEIIPVKEQEKELYENELATEKFLKLSVSSPANEENTMEIFAATSEPEILLRRRERNISSNHLSSEFAKILLSELQTELTRKLELDQMKVKVKTLNSQDEEFYRNKTTLKEFITSPTEPEDKNPKSEDKVLNPFALSKYLSVTKELRNTVQFQKNESENHILE